MCSDDWFDVFKRVWPGIRVHRTQRVEWGKVWKVQGGVVIVTLSHLTVVDWGEMIDGV